MSSGHKKSKSQTILESWECPDNVDGVHHVLDFPRVKPEIIHLLTLWESGSRSRSTNIEMIYQRQVTLVCWSTNVHVTLQAFESLQLVHWLLVISLLIISQKIGHVCVIIVVIRCRVVFVGHDAWVMWRAVVAVVCLIGWPFVRVLDVIRPRFFAKF